MCHAVFTIDSSLWYVNVKRYTQQALTTYLACLRKLNQYDLKIAMGNICAKDAIPKKSFQTKCRWHLRRKSAIEKNTCHNDARFAIPVPYASWSTEDQLRLSYSYSNDKHMDTLNAVSIIFPYIYSI